MEASAAYLCARCGVSALWVLLFEMKHLLGVWKVGEPESSKRSLELVVWVGGLVEGCSRWTVVPSWVDILRRKAMTLDGCWGDHQLALIQLLGVG